MTFYTFIEPLRLEAWGHAVGSQFRAQEDGSRRAWAEAARAWDALAKLYTHEERDREIFVSLGREAWFKVLFLRSDA
jgi:hypothetical protein